MIEAPQDKPREVTIEKPKKENEPREVTIEKPKKEEPK